MSSRTMPSGLTLCAAVVLSSSVAAPCAHAQANARALLQLEVGDSIGLPLPDASLEVYTAVERGIFREWIAVEPDELPAGNWLLRISHPGYRTSIQSVPLRKDGPFALRVRLLPQGDTTSRSRTVVAEHVHAIGMAVGERTGDVMAGRRIIDRLALERSGAKSFRDVVDRTKDLDITIVSGPGGVYTLGGDWPGAAKGCLLREIVNGKTGASTSLANLDDSRDVDEIEAIEVLPRRTGDLYVRDARSQSYCGMVIVWVKDR
jgi:hypothetical protein